MAVPQTDTHLHTPNSTLTHPAGTSLHRTLLTNALTSRTPDSQHSLTLPYALQLCSFPSLTAAVCYDISLPGVGSPAPLVAGLSRDMAALAASIANLSQMFNLHVATVSARAIKCI